jgi:hypothetical protein
MHSMRTSHLYLCLLSIEISAFFAPSFATSCFDCSVSLPCVAGTYLTSDPAISICNLSAYYAFDQDAFLADSTGKASDLAPYLRTAEESAPTQSFSCLFSSGCAYFDNGGFAVDDVWVGEGNALSISLWYKVGPTRSIWQRLFDFGQGPASNNILLARDGLSINNLDTLIITVFKDGAFLLPNLPVSTTAFATTNQWVHVCMTLSSTADWRIYLDGSLAWSAANMPFSNVLLTENLIGTSNWNSDAPYNGLMDDFRIYLRELSAQEARATHAHTDTWTRPLNGRIGIAEA